MGGCPYLEDISEYPVEDNGKPMIFLAQINLSELVELDHMPKRGLLQFYIHYDDCHGYDRPCKVRYIEEFITDENKLVTENPYEETYQDLLPFEREGKMLFKLREMPISTSCDSLFNKVFSSIEFSDEQEEKIWEEFCAAGSRVGDIHTLFNQSRSIVTNIIFYYCSLI